MYYVQMYVRFSQQVGLWEAFLLTMQVLWQDIQDGSYWSRREQGGSGLGGLVAPVSAPPGIVVPPPPMPTAPAPVYIPPAPPPITPYPVPMPQPPAAVTPPPSAPGSVSSGPGGVFGGVGVETVVTGDSYFDARTFVAHNGYPQGIPDGSFFQVVNGQAIGISDYAWQHRVLLPGAETAQ